MKKLLLATLLGVLSLTACESENEFHQTSFDKSGIVMYADQVVDSVLLFYSDNWTATLADGSWVNLLSVTKNDQGTIVSSEKVGMLSGTSQKDALLISTPIYVTAEPNATGVMRYATLNVSSHENASIMITQLPMLNVTYPYYRFKEGTEISSENLIYEDDLVASSTEGKVICTIYREGATLTSDAAWCTPEISDLSVGTNTIMLILEPNTTPLLRTATLTLTSGGVSMPITINQAGKIDD